MRIFILLISFISFQAISQISVSQNCKSDINQAVLLQKQGKFDQQEYQNLPINQLNGKYYMSFLAKINEHFNQLLLEDQGILVGAEINNIISLKYPFLTLL